MKIYSFLLFLLVQIFASNTFAQVEFAQIYGELGSNKFNHVNLHPTNDTYYAVGESNGRACLSQIDLDGSLMWTRVYGPAFSEFSSFVFTPNGELMLAGRANTDQSVADIFVQRVDQSGNLVWNGNNSIIQIGNDDILDDPERVTRVKIVAHSPTFDWYFITALVAYRDFNDNNMDNLVKLLIDGQGNQDPNTSIVYYGHRNRNDQIYDVISDNIGCIYYCGNSPNGINNDLSLLSYLNRGCGTGLSGENVFRVGNGFSNSLLSLTRTSDNGFLLAGVNDYDTSTSLLSGDGIIIRLRADKGVQWKRRIGDGIGINSIIEMDDNMIVVSRAGTDNGVDFIELLHLNPDGSFSFGQRFNGYTGFDGTNNIRLEHTGGGNDLVIINASTTGSPDGFGNVDPVVIVVDPAHLSCIGESITVNPVEHARILHSYPMPSREFTISRLNNTINSTEIWENDNLCCIAPPNCTASSDLTACAEEEGYGFIHFECEEDLNFEWGLPQGSTAIEVANGASLLQASEGLYNLTITDENGCEDIKAFEIVSDCCISCQPPIGLNCKKMPWGPVRLGWEEIPNAIDYEVTIVTATQPSVCGCISSPNPTITVNTGGQNYHDHFLGITSCFTWTVKAICADGTSVSSTEMCFNPGFGCSEVE